MKRSEQLAQEEIERLDAELEQLKATWWLDATLVVSMAGVVVLGFGAAACLALLFLV